MLLKALNSAYTRLRHFPKHLPISKDVTYNGNHRGFQQLINSIDVNWILNFTPTYTYIFPSLKSWPVMNLLISGNFQNSIFRLIERRLFELSPRSLRTISIRIGDASLTELLVSNVLLVRHISKQKFILRVGVIQFIISKEVSLNFLKEINTHLMCCWKKSISI